MTRDGPGRIHRSLVGPAILLVLVAACASTVTPGATQGPALPRSGDPSSSGVGPTPRPTSVTLPSTAIPSPVATSVSAEASAQTALAIPVALEARVSRLPRSVEDRGWEPIVATHPTDPDRIAVVFEHQGPGAACRTNPTIRISHDGGRTWRSTRRSPATGSRRGMGLHAAIAWGPGPSGGSRLYWTNMTTPGCGDPRFSLTTSYSDDEGATWSRLHVERRTRPWVGGFPDIAVDRDPASPAYGTVYVGYNWLPRGARGPGFRLLASADFGRTWSAANVAPAPSPSGFRDWWRIAYRVRPAPDGSVYASWYQADLRHWDRSNIFAKGGSGNVGRLGVAVARVTFDRHAKTFVVGSSRIATTVRETSFTAAGSSAPGTAGNIRPDPMWLHGFDVDRATGRLYLAVAGYGAPTKKAPRGTIRVGYSDDAGASWSFSRVPSVREVRGHRQSSFKPNLVAGPGYVLVTFHTLDDVRSGATVGVAYAVSTDGGVSWRTPAPVSNARWRARNIGGVINGIGLRERAELTAGGDVFWVYGDGRRATGSSAGRIAIFGTHIRLTDGHLK